MQNKRVLITLQKRPVYYIISTCLQGNQHPFTTEAASARIAGGHSGGTTAAQIHQAGISTGRTKRNGSLVVIVPVIIVIPSEEGGLNKRFHRAAVFLGRTAGTAGTVDETADA